MSDIAKALQELPEHLADLVVAVRDKTRNQTLEEAAKICAVAKEGVRGFPEKDMAYWAFDWCETKIRALQKDEGE